tara:strand:+ start:912 stop:2879 length:1968 start_codon:yes stop_codon:yes gene_type:complete
MISNYRNEVDGLRAIAVISVIIYHGFLTLPNGNYFFKGGFLGVDIFFVISGFVITRILLYEFKNSKHIDLKNFFIRRAKRIYPTLLVTSLFFAVIFMFKPIPGLATQFVEQVISSILFVSNIFFFKQGNLYGDIDSLLLPMLHTWSLSVEGQFYLIAPFILIFILKFFQKYLISTFFVFIFISLFLNIFNLLLPIQYNNIISSANFYFLPTRSWEFLSGGLIALHDNRNKKINISLKMQNIIQIFAIFLIFISFLTLQNNNLNYISSLLVVIPTCLLILFSSKKLIVNRILSHEILIFIGKISFSLYMFHFLIFSLHRLYSFSNTLSFSISELLILSIITFCISLINYFFIEIKIRKKTFSVKTFFIFSFSIILSILTVLILITNDKKIYSNKFFYEKYYSNYTVNWKNYSNEIKDFVMLNKNKLESNNHNNNNNKKILIVGDSHSEDLFVVLSHAYLNNKKIIFDNICCNTDLMNLRNNLITDEKFDFLLKNTKYKNADIILFAFNWLDVPLTSFEKLLKKIEKNKQIIIVSKRNNFNIYKNKFTKIDFILYDYHVNKNKKSPLDLSNYQKVEYKSQVIKNYNINLSLKKLANKYKFKYLKTEDYECNIKKNFCYYLTDNLSKIYFDSHHYTISGARFFGEIIKNTNWFNKSFN